MTKRKFKKYLEDRRLLSRCRWDGGADYCLLTEKPEDGQVPSEGEGGGKR